jgi:hypothetical protein
VGKVAAANLGAILYALEVCATTMDNSNRAEDARYYRTLASHLAEAGGTEGGTMEGIAEQGAENGGDQS